MSFEIPFCKYNFIKVSEGKKGTWQLIKRATVLIVNTKNSYNNYAKTNLKILQAIIEDLLEPWWVCVFHAYQFLDCIA